MPSSINRPSERGNAVIYILLTVMLFAALAYAFMRGGQQGQANMTTQQAKVKAQELAGFFNTVGKAVDKLRSKGCAESQLSFANSADTGAFIASNDPATAPADKSCDVFDTAGGGVTFNMNWRDYQLSLDVLTAMQPANVPELGNLRLRTSTSTVGVGTAANDLMASLNFVDREVCRQYNNLLQNDIDETVADLGPLLGDENTDYVGKESVCRYSTGANGTLFGQIRQVWVAH